VVTGVPAKVELGPPFPLAMMRIQAASSNWYRVVGVRAV